jgi:hypothetical protein
MSVASSAPDPTRGSSWSTAKPTEHAGVLYDSKAEARRAGALELLRRAGKIASWCRAPRFDLRVGAEDVVVGWYTPDFLVVHLDGTREAIEVKGRASRDLALRLNHFRAQYPEIRLSVLDGDGNPWKPPRRKRGQLPAALLRRVQRGRAR